MSSSSSSVQPSRFNSEVDKVKQAYKKLFLKKGGVYAKNGETILLIERINVLHQMKMLNLERARLNAETGEKEPMPFHVKREIDVIGNQIRQGLSRLEKRKKLKQLNPEEDLAGLKELKQRLEKEYEEKQKLHRIQLALKTFGRWETLYDGTEEEGDKRYYRNQMLTAARRYFKLTGDNELIKRMPSEQTKRTKRTKRDNDEEFDFVFQLTQDDQKRQKTDYEIEDMLKLLRDPSWLDDRSYEHGHSSSPHRPGHSSSPHRPGHSSSSHHR